jgi:hypothetical protein
VVPGLELGVEGRYPSDSIFTACTAVIDGAAGPASISDSFHAFTPGVSLN